MGSIVLRYIGASLITLGVFQVAFFYDYRGGALLFLGGGVLGILGWIPADLHRCEGCKALIYSAHDYCSVCNQRWWGPRDPEE